MAAAVGTKRSAECDEYEEEVKVVKSESEAVEMRMLLVGHLCGGVVGKGGENLSRLRREYSVDVQMPGCRTVDRVFSMIGVLEDCLNVVKEILLHASKAPYPVAQKTDLEVNMLVDTDLVGQILGKGGSKIKEIREESGTKIKIYEDCLPNSTERVVAVGGNDEKQITHALKLIMNVLEGGIPRRSNPVFYDPVNKPNEFIRNFICGVGTTTTTTNNNNWGNDTRNNWEGNDIRNNQNPQSDFLPGGGAQNNVLQIHHVHTHHHYHHFNATDTGTGS